MSILVDAIRISGFRGIENLEASLTRVTVLIGPNNSGKTSLIKALQLCLGDYSRGLTEEDFFISQTEKRAPNILIDVRIIPIDASGVRTPTFGVEWAIEFGDRIKAEANGNQFVVVRSRSAPNPTKGGFDTNRFTLEAWPDYVDWSSKKVKETRLTNRFPGLPFISMEAQRDIHQDLRDRSSFIGKVLATVEYDPKDIKDIEDQVKAVNDAAVDKSTQLKSLKGHLEKLNQAFGCKGEADVTPFPKKLRDLSKNFSVHFGETPQNSFSMEYHGMGTRSWASMLTIRSFVDILTERHAAESEALFPIFAAEEPEAHLHPDAQKSLYAQLAEMSGQVLISTHSPYLAAKADLYQIRSLVKSSTGVNVHQIAHILEPEEKKIVAREVLAKRGEFLFARCILLFEGVSEEQVVPAMFEQYLKVSPWSVGAACISVGGKGYSPYVMMAASFGTPICILSDCDGNTPNEISAQIRRLEKRMGKPLNPASFTLNYLPPGRDFEAELIAHGLREELIDALVICATKGSSNTRFIDAKHREFSALDDDALTEKLRSEKASYAGFLADVILENPRGKTPEELVPLSIRAVLDRLNHWVQ